MKPPQIRSNGILTQTMFIFWSLTKELEKLCLTNLSGKTYKAKMDKRKLPSPRKRLNSGDTAFFFFFNA